MGMLEALEIIQRCARCSHRVMQPHSTCLMCGLLFPELHTLAKVGHYVAHNVGVGIPDLHPVFAILYDVADGIKRLLGALRRPFLARLVLDPSLLQPNPFDPSGFWGNSTFTELDLPAQPVYNRHIRGVKPRRAAFAKSWIPAYLDIAMPDRIWAVC
jgi:hypothetical protein